MIRLTEVKLPLDHAPEALRAVHIHRRAADARKRGAIRLTYTRDLDTADEAAILRRFADAPHVSPTPDMGYRPPTRAPQHFSRPPVNRRRALRAVCRASLAEMGFRSSWSR